MKISIFLSFLICNCLATSVWSQSELSKDKSMVLQLLSDRSNHYGDIAMQIWDYAELGFLEDESIAVLISELENKYLDFGFLKRKNNRELND